MNINFVAQPDRQLGTLLANALTSPPLPSGVVLISAFASLQAVLRLKQHLLTLQKNATQVRLVVGVDMGGTSKEVLRELSEWPIEVFIFKNRKSGVTFHPKLYVVEKVTSAEIFLGSNNLTDGGLYGNYEGAVHVTYSLPGDADALATAKTQLGKFLNPAAPVGRRLDGVYLKQLLARGDIPSERESRQRRKATRINAGPGTIGENVFGFESTPGPPQLPMQVKDVVLAAVQRQLDEFNAEKRAVRKQRRRIKLAAVVSKRPLRSALPEEPHLRNFSPLEQITPTAFYLELTTTSGKADNLPGEQRIPLEALNAAQEFWGWPDDYTESVNPRKGLAAPGIRRVYLERKPTWRVYSVNDPTKDVTVAVRMYFVEANSDFRFHSGALAGWAQAGDMVCITRVENRPYLYECALAVAGTPEHGQWRALCRASSGRSPRVFGYS